eukprot:GCRY01002234.1.p1 GENE.GCRY01002234.1~~GCRY01002234.1.p1  ORF type:complete len:229 (-),score=35.55 GCRY01002234.1:370-1056(-)
MKLSYFSKRGGRVATPSALLLDSGALFESEVIPFQFGKASPEWEALKPKTPFGKLPLLQDDEFLLGETLVICSYIAEKYGYYPENMNQKWICQMIATSCIEDIDNGVFRVNYMRTAEDRINQISTAKGLLKSRFQRFEKLLLNGKPFFFGEKVTLADVAFFVTCVKSAFVLSQGQRTPIEEGFFTELPNLRLLFEQLLVRPGLKLWHEQVQEEMKKILEIKSKMKEFN